MTAQSLPATERACLGLLHPGEMGTALARVVKNQGIATCWLSSGRSQASRDRAAAVGMIETTSLAEFCARSSMIIAICPPHAALDVARQVAAQGFPGIYVDANAISPDHARQVNLMIASSGGRFVDGAIVGPPPAPGTRTRFYLSGQGAEEVAELFTTRGVQVVNLGPEPGRASALKMCHSAIHKTQLAMLFATLASAEHFAVREELCELWGSRTDTAGLAQGLEGNLRRLAKAWRFAGEMAEVADTFAAAGLPASFHSAASEVFSRLSALPQGATETQVLQILRTAQPLPPG